MSGLISRAALVEEIEWLKANTGEYNHAELDEYIQRIKNAPAVDAEPVRHGRWEPMVVSSGRESWKCSECGRRARGKLKNLPYCHCGAKMDGGVNE